MKLSIEAQELLEYAEPLAAAAHLFADSHADVIYTNRAHDLVRNASVEERNEAEEAVGDTTSEYVSYDSNATLLAYYIVRHRYEREMRTELEEYAESEDIPEEHKEAIREILS